ncbi:MAG: ribonuclease III [Chitinophagaceae bacterium]|nr:ribonuclease III [Chitinophagaceae bacterium]
MVLRWMQLLGKRRTENEILFETTIKELIGEKPSNIELYKLSVLHKSISKIKTHHGITESNERLEYLGDAVLNMIVAEYLFNKYPFKNEGFLTQVRSRIVSREHMNIIAKKMRIHNLINIIDTSKNFLNTNIYGNTLEALIAAVYIDKGYNFCKKFIITKIIMPHVDTTQVIINNNHKGILLQWAQKHSTKLDFQMVESPHDRTSKRFKSLIILNNEEIGIGWGSNKKKAEQESSANACKKIQII